MQEFLAEEKIVIEETIDANVRLGKARALELAGESAVIVVSKGANVVEFDMQHDPPDQATLLSHMLGPTGNLRAPTVQIGKTLLVGFHPDVYRAHL